MSELKQLILNPNFARGGKGWRFVHASIASAKRHSVELAGGVKGDEPNSAIAATLDDIPTQHFLHFSCDLPTAETEGNVIIRIYAFDDNGEVVTRTPATKQASFVIFVRL